MSPSDHARAALDALYETVAYLERDNRLLRLQREAMAEQKARDDAAFRRLAQEYHDQCSPLHFAP